MAAAAALVAISGAAVPLAMSGTATAKGGGTTPPVLAITKCSPGTATIGKAVTIHGTALTAATKVTIAGKNVTTDITANTAKAIKISPVPAGIPVTPNAATVKVWVGTTSASGSCNFKHAPKKKKHKK
jgi:hypothetical protein